MEKHYDIIIIGAGLAGLYSAYNIKKMYPKTNLLVLDSNRRPFIGGRIGNSQFYGANIVVGAGVGREDTDFLLINLLKELHIKYNPFLVKMHYSKQIKNPIDIISLLKILRAQYKKENSPPVTFKEFASKYLGKEGYNNFIISSGYSDYEKEDAYEVLYHYQLEDNGPGWTGLEIPWSTLVNKLCEKIGYQNILTSKKVDYIHKLQKTPCKYEIITNNNHKYLANKVIIATRINTVQKLLPNYPIYKQIFGQPFLYIYAKFDKESANIMSQIVSTYTIVTGPLQKMIPFSKSVYMIAYADNENAIYLKDYKENIETNRRFFAKKVEEALGLLPNTLKIIAIRDFYWPIGTHYYSPLNHHLRTEFIKKAQHPEPGLLIVGECVSRRQGWTEGALESVHAVLNKKWINTFYC